jgi:glutamate synthase (NADPH/NADH) small chain
MEYLYQRNRAVAQMEGREFREVAPEDVITAKDKNVVVIGGGDTGMDCVSNAMREGAKSVKLLDVYPQVPENGRYDFTPWPMQPRRLVTTYALDEGGEREFGTEVVGIEGDGTSVTGIAARKVTGNSSRTLVPVEGSDYTEPADLVLVAIGFTNPEHEGLVNDLGLDLDRSGNVKASTFTTSVENFYAAGDVRVGASLVVTAIAEGRRCARVVDHALRAEASAAA